MCIRFEIYINGTLDRTNIETPLSPPPHTQKKCLMISVCVCVCVFAETDHPSNKHDFQELFKGVKSTQNSQKVTIDIDVQHPSLKPRLRPYQQDAVRWMLKQELYGQEDNAESSGWFRIGTQQQQYMEIKPTSN